MSFERFRNTVISMIFIVGALIVASYSSSEYNNYKRITLQSGKARATITSIEMEPINGKSGMLRRPRVGVEFIVDGNCYNTFIATYTKDMFVGKEINIFYKKDNPNITISKPQFVNVLYIIAGLMAICGIVIFVINPE